MITINNLPCQPYESFAASAQSERHYFEVRRDIADVSGKTRIRMASTTRDLSVVFYLKADELDALQTMLAEAYDSQEREA